MSQARWRLARVRRLEAEVVRALAKALIGNTADKQLTESAGASDRAVDKLMDKLIALPSRWPRYTPEPNEPICHSVGRTPSSAADPPVGLLSPAGPPPR